MKKKKSCNRYELDKAIRKENESIKQSRVALLKLIIDKILDDNIKLTSCQIRMMVTDFMQLI